MFKKTGKCQGKCILETKLQKKQDLEESPRPTISPVFLEVAKEYIDIRATELSQNTIRNMVYVFNHYALELVGQKPVTLLTMEDMRAIERCMIERHIKTRSNNTHCHYLKKMLDWAVEEKRFGLKVNPWATRRNLKAKRFRFVLLTVEGFQVIHAKAAPHLAWAMVVAYHTGVRTGSSELFALKWSNVDWEKGGIHIYGRKTDTWRWQDPDPEFMKRLRLRQLQQQKDYPACLYACHFEGKPIKSVKTAWAQAKKDAASPGGSVFRSSGTSTSPTRWPTGPASSTWPKGKGTWTAT